MANMRITARCVGCQERVEVDKATAMESRPRSSCCQNRTHECQEQHQLQQECCWVGLSAFAWSHKSKGVRIVGRDSKTGKRFLLGVSDECLVQSGYRLFCPQPLYRGQPPARTLGGKILFSWATLNQDECHQQYRIRLWNGQVLTAKTCKDKGNNETCIVLSKQSQLKNDGNHSPIAVLKTKQRMGSGGAVLTSTAWQVTQFSGCGVGVPLMVSLASTILLDESERRPISLNLFQRDKKNLQAIA